MTPTKQRLLVIGLIVIGFTFVIFFGIRFFHAFREFNGHRPSAISQKRIGCLGIFCTRR